MLTSVSMQNMSHKIDRVSRRIKLIEGKLEEMAARLWSKDVLAEIERGWIDKALNDVGESWQNESDLIVQPSSLPAGIMRQQTSKKMLLSDTLVEEHNVHFMAVSGSIEEEEEEEQAHGVAVSGSSFGSAARSHGFKDLDTRGGTHFRRLTYPKARIDAQIAALVDTLVCADPLAQGTNGWQGGGGGGGGGGHCWKQGGQVVEETGSCLMHPSVGRDLRIHAPAHTHLTHATPLLSGSVAARCGEKEEGERGSEFKSAGSMSASEGVGRRGVCVGEWKGKEDELVRVLQELGIDGRHSSRILDLFRGVQKDSTPGVDLWTGATATHYNTAAH